MYQAYLSSVSPDEIPYGAQDGVCAVGVSHNDPGSAMNAIRGYHARNVCDSPADYFITGPDGDVVAYITMPASSANRQIP